jgi:hypothetical protein
MARQQQRLMMLTFIQALPTVRVWSEHELVN